MTDIIEDAIHDAYEELAALLGTGTDGQARFAHVVAHERDASPSAIGRRGFLSYLRWAIAHPDHILGPPDTECPCRGSGWYEVDGGSVERCPAHQPPVNRRHEPDERARQVAARGREMDEQRVR